jgi:hypothetical protein
MAQCYGELFELMIPAPSANANADRTTAHRYPDTASVAPLRRKVSWMQRSGGRKTEIKIKKNKRKFAPLQLALDVTLPPVRPTLLYFCYWTF